ncbi:Hypothetical protein NocV09_02000910 [Nannochloropsis oceanica]
MVRYLSGNGTVLHHSNLRRTVSASCSSSSSSSSSSSTSTSSKDTKKAHNPSSSGLPPPPLPTRSSTTTSTISNASTTATTTAPGSTSTLSSLSLADLGLSNLNLALLGRSNSSSTSSFLPALAGGIHSPYMRHLRRESTGSSISSMGGSEGGREGERGGGCGSGGSSTRVTRAECENCGFKFLCAWSKGGSAYCSLDCRTTHNLHGVEDAFNHLPTGGSIEAAEHCYSLTPQKQQYLQQQQTVEVSPVVHVEVPDQPQLQGHVGPEAVVPVPAPATGGAEVIAAATMANVNTDPAITVVDTASGIISSCSSSITTTDATFLPREPGVIPSSASPLPLQAQQRQQEPGRQQEENTAPPPILSLLDPNAVVALGPRPHACPTPSMMVMPCVSSFSTSNNSSHSDSGGIEGQAARPPSLLPSLTQPLPESSSATCGRGSGPSPSLFDSAQIASLERRRHAALHLQPPSLQEEEQQQQPLQDDEVQWPQQQQQQEETVLVRPQARLPASRAVLTATTSAGALDPTVHAQQSFKSLTLPCLPRHSSDRDMTGACRQQHRHEQQHQLQQQQERKQHKWYQQHQQRESAIGSPFERLAAAIRNV